MDIYEMDIGDFYQFDNCSYLRVPGGWIVTIYRLDSGQMNSVFVPYNNEFQKLPDNTPF